MKRMIAVLILLWFCLGLAAVAVANCTIQTIFLPGRTIVCSVCCSGDGSCTSICS